jgi:MFS family permease
VAQGVPFGFATEYLPVVLRKAHYSMTSMGAVMLLQLPWQLKILWAPVADRPWARMRTRGILLVAQILLGIVISCFAIAPFADAPMLWFGLTVLAALVASTQDVFVDATAVRALSVSDRGLGNTAQVAGYRLGMLFGGAWLLLLIGRLGNRGAVLSCGAIVMATAAAAFLMREGAITDEPHPEKPNLRATLQAAFGRTSWRVFALALLFKMGIHVVTVPMKAMPVDAKWTTQQIALAGVIVGTTCGLLGAGVGGVLHGRISERKALFLAAVLQALVCLPLLAAYAKGAPVMWTSVSIAVESFASGLGTTVLFAALMSATRVSDAGLHYTLLTGANAIALWVGGIAGGAIADHFGKPAAFIAAAIVSLLPIGLLRNWETARAASAGT